MPVRATEEIGKWRHSSTALLVFTRAYSCHDVGGKLLAYHRRRPRFDSRSLYVAFAVEISDTGTALSPSSSVFPRQYLKTNDPYSFTHVTLRLSNERRR